MAKSRSAWGIDVGQCALKALKLRNLGGQLQVEAFDIVEHAKILSEPEADRAQLVRDALMQFLSRNSVLGSVVGVSVPGQTGFTRFVKLPPVESKRVPDIVRFEAEQQIPFPIADVIWRWQTFAGGNSPDMEVGIFAMKRVDVASMLEHFNEVELPVDVVQMAPLSLYNFMKFDAQIAEDGATLLVDIGADKTDLVVADGARIWTRTIQIGGNNFTQALVKAFKLTFRKAEKLKRTAASSKYARQIFQAMRPVFSDLVQEIQRSVGYYTSLHRESRFQRLVGMGNGFRLPGMQKFLEQNLNVQVARVDNYAKLNTAGTVNAATFTENVLSFGVAYGLAVQGLGLAPVYTNLLPVQIARARLWKKKQPWFAGAAAVVLLALGSMLYSVRADIAALDKTKGELVRSQSHLKEMKTWRSEHSGLKNQGTQELEQINFSFRLFGYRDFWPSVQAIISQSIKQVTGSDQQMLSDYIAAAGDDEQSRKKQEELLAKIKMKKRSTRQQIFIESMNYQYLADVSSAVTAGAAMGSPSDLGGGEARRGYQITLAGRTPLPRSEANRLIQALLDAMKTVAEKKAFSSVYIRHCDIESLETYGGDSRSVRSTRSAARARFGRDGEGRRRGDGDRRGRYESPTIEPAEQVSNPDPLLTGESMSEDTKFTIVVIASIESDGVKLPSQSEAAAE